MACSIFSTLLSTLRIVKVSTSNSKTHQILWHWHLRPDFIKFAKRSKAQSTKKLVALGKYWRTYKICNIFKKPFLNFSCAALVTWAQWLKSVSALFNALTNCSLQFEVGSINMAKYFCQRFMTDPSPRHIKLIRLKLW